MKRVLIILYYIVILIGCSIPFLNKKYTHHYYGNNVKNIKFDTYTDRTAGELSYKCYYFDYTNKDGVDLQVKGSKVYDNIKWFESELRKGNYYDSIMDPWWIVLCVICYIRLFFIIIQYIVYWMDESNSVSYCRGSGCPLKTVCPLCQVCQDSIVNDDFIFLKFYKWFGNNFIKFWGYENNS